MVVHGLIAAGMETVVARLTRGLTRRGHDVGITCIEFQGVLGQQLREEGFRVTTLPIPGLGPILFPSRLASWLAELGPDVVHAHSGAWIKAARAVHRAHVPRFVFTLHGIEGSEPWHEGFFNFWAGRYTDAIAVVSAPLVDYLKRSGVPARRIHVVRNGIDTEMFRPASSTLEAREAAGLPRDRPIIGHVARFAPVKNHLFLLDCFAAIVRERPDTLLVLVGDGPLRSEVETRIAKLDLAGNVLLLGERSDMARLYRTFDVFVLPSLNEGTSMSILEAMASGTPVLASRVGGTPDLLAGGDVGVLFEPTDSERFVALLLDLLDDSTRRAELGRLARARVTEEFSESSTLDRYEDLYGVRRHASSPKSIGIEAG